MNNENNEKTYIYEIYTEKKELRIQGLVTASTIEEAKIKVSKIMGKITAVMLKAIDGVVTELHIKLLTAIGEWDGKTDSK